MLRAKHLLFLLPILALAGFTGYKVFQAVKAREAAEQAASAPKAGGGARLQNVQTGVVATGKISETITLTGALKAKEQVDVTPQLAGRLIQLTVDTGQSVTRGALVGVLQDDELAQQMERSKAAIAVVDASIAQREAELNNAKVELERKRKLVEEGLLSRLELDALETRFRVSQSQLELARAQRRQSEAEQRELAIRQSQMRIYAPLSGVVSKRHVTVGALLNASTPLVTIVSVNPMVIMANVSEREIARIKRGALVGVTIDSLPGQNFSGRIMRIAPLLDPQTRNGQVEIEIPNRGGVLKGEMFARADLDLGSQRETVLLPRDALVYRGEQPGVYTIEAEKAKFRTVETGLTQADKVEVINGIKAGEVVITRGSNLLKDGDRVKVQTSNGEPKPAGDNTAQVTNEQPGAPRPSGPSPQSATK